MAESDELLRGVKKLEAGQEYHSHVLELLLRAQDQEQLRADILPLLRREQVFRAFAAVDGASSGVQIAEKTNIPQPTVSRYLTSLAQHGLIKLLTAAGAKIYARTPMYDLLELHRYLPRELTDEYAATRRRSRRRDT
jgi:DNA-binding MarR family transcriptional regulator